MGNETQNIRWDFDMQNLPQPDDQTTRLNNNHKKKWGTCRIVDFATPVDHGVKLKKKEKGP